MESHCKYVYFHKVKKIGESYILSLGLSDSLINYTRYNSYDQNVKNISLR